MAPNYTSFSAGLEKAGHLETSTVDSLMAFSTADELPPFKGPDASLVEEFMPFSRLGTVVEFPSCRRLGACSTVDELPACSRAGASNSIDDLPTCNGPSPASTLDDLPQLRHEHGHSHERLPSQRFFSENSLPELNPSGSSRTCADLPSLDCGWGILGFTDFGYEFLDTGSFSRGTVRRAVHRADGHEVAVRCLCTRDQEKREAARSEYRLLSSLRHPNIVRAEAFYESRFDVWLCMERCESTSVAAYVEAKGPWSEPLGVGLIAHLLRALEYLHGRHIVHCAVWARHLLLQDDATVLKLGDFRRAKTLESSMEAETPMNRPAPQVYTAPEIATGGLWSEPADIWAFGVCAYFMLRGELPTDFHSKLGAKTVQDGEFSNLKLGALSEGVRVLVRSCFAAATGLGCRPSARDLLATVQLFANCSHNARVPQECLAQ